VIVDCPVDYSENMKLTKKLKELTSPVWRPVDQRLWKSVPHAYDSRARLFLPRQ
jgi:hypothetical protein